jgi:UDP-galactopyranose mutase
MDKTPIVAFSHLRWNSVFQRPHHIMSRLASRRDVLFVEEPLPHRGEASLEVTRVAPRLRVVQPRVPLDQAGFGSQRQDALEGALRNLLHAQGWDGFVAWLHTPGALPVARALRPRAMVYDCVEDLSAIRFAPAHLRERERDLFGCCNVVFTGSPSLYRAKRGLHPSVHCFPSSVDMAHFAGANGIPEAREQEEIPRPRFGFFGVIDDRMDLGILRTLAAERPEWQIILVGPVARIDEALLPHAANIHYMGQRPYQDLPSFLAGWDACLIPFAMNATTRFLSPTKCLEYMAANRPIVSTPIQDVTEPYGDIVHVGSGPRGFVEACGRALNDSGAARSIRRALASQVLRETSWDETVERMNAIVSRLGGTPSRSERWVGAQPVPRFAS